MMNIINDNLDKTLLKNNRTFTKEITARDNISLFLRFWNNSNRSDNRTIVVILHGLGGHSKYYEDFGALLSESGIIVCAYDRRGHGKSGGERGDIKNADIDLNDLNDIISWLRSNFANSKLFILGESWGCLIALYYLYKYKETTSGVIFLSPPITPNIERSWLKPFFKFSFQLFKNFATLHFNGTLGPFFPLELASRDPKFNRLLTTDKITNLEMKLHYGLVIFWLHQKAKHYASQLKLPSLILQGECDKLLRRDNAEKLFTIIPSTDKKLVIIREAYHTLYADPETPQVVKTIANWIESERLHSPQR